MTTTVSSKKKKQRLTKRNDKSSSIANDSSKVKGNNLNVNAKRGHKVKHDVKQDSKILNEDQWSKAKKKRMRKILSKRRLDSRVDSQKVKTAKKSDSKKVSLDIPTGEDRVDESAKNIDTKRTNDDDKTEKKKQSLQEQFKERLLGSRFRMLNEELYTTTSEESLKRFQKNPDLFDQYHGGFRTQVSRWPMNPVDVIFRWIQKKIKKCNNSDGEFVIVDFGCGDAQLSRNISDYMQKHTMKGKVQVHSLDLVSGGNPLVTACDMASVPHLSDCSVDVAVYCLSLMGTNVADFIREAHRVLKEKGIVKIAEVRSRFESTTASNVAEDNNHESKGGKRQKVSSCAKEKKTADRSGVDEFVRVMKRLGFRCTDLDRTNNYFFMMEFQKNGKVPCKEAEYSLRPCLYKRR